MQEGWKIGNIWLRIPIVLITVYHDQNYTVKSSMSNVLKPTERAAVIKTFIWRDDIFNQNYEIKITVDLMNWNGWESHSSTIDFK